MYGQSVQDAKAHWESGPYAYLGGKGGRGIRQNASDFGMEIAEGTRGGLLGNRSLGGALGLQIIFWRRTQASILRVRA